MTAKQAGKKAQRESPMTALAEKLRAAGLRRTGPRVAVLERLTRADAPVSHGELADDLEHLGFDRATVYRNLIDLTNAGLVARTDMGDHVWRFSLVKQGDVDHGRRHPHLLCTDCGTIVCLPDVKVKIATAPGKRRIADMEVQLKGLCESCEH
jgi:Fur family transcriptional regulator, ferric uptake regulator